MVKTVHVRTSLDAVLQSLEARLAAEGFSRTHEPLPKREIEVGGRMYALPAETPPNMRCVVVHAKDGWVAVADDPFASTTWGEHLSRDCASPAITLEGERDHAFYSSIVVHENGVSVHESQVPRDAVLGADGRHRIRPTFLARYIASATAKLEEGIVVDRLGGEGNVAAVAEALSIPNALLSPLDDDDDASDARVRLLFRFEGAQRESAPSVESFGANAAKLFAMLAGAGGGDDLVPEGFGAELIAGLAHGFIPGARRDEALALEAPFSSREVGFVSDDHQCHTTFRLVGGRGASTRGVTICIDGDGLALFDVTKVSIRTRDGAELEGRVEASPQERGGLAARFPTIQLSQAPSPDLDALPVHERARQSMKTLTLAAHAFADPAEIVVYLSGTLVREGRGDLAVRAETMTLAVDEEGDTYHLEATSRLEIEVKPALRIPLLPEWVTPEHLRANRPSLEAYSSRDVAFGWIAFDRDWSDVKDVVTRMATDLERLFLEIQSGEPLREQVVLDRDATQGDIEIEIQRGKDVLLRAGPDGRELQITRRDDGCFHVGEPSTETRGAFRAEVLRKGGESLEFPAPIRVAPNDATWTKIQSELDRGADVVLITGPCENETRIEISHRSGGRSNHYPVLGSGDHEQRLPRVVFTWSCPRPSSAGSWLALGTIATELLVRAGQIEGNLGGLASASGRVWGGTLFEAPYETLAGTRMLTNDARWLGKHARSPGYRVLLPGKAIHASRSVDDVEELVGRTELAHGALLASRAPDPFAYDATYAAAMERAVLPSVGTRAEIAEETLP